MHLWIYKYNFTFLQHELKALFKSPEPTLSRISATVETCKPYGTNILKILHFFGPECINSLCSIS